MAAIELRFDELSAESALDIEIVKKGRSGDRLVAQQEAGQKVHRGTANHDRMIGSKGTLMLMMQEDIDKVLSERAVEEH